MRFHFFVIVIAFLLLKNTVYSQTVEKEFWDGTVYFKIKGNQSQIPKEWDLTKDGYDGLLRDLQISDLSRAYGFTAIEKHFRTPALQGIYKIHFSEINKADLLIRDLYKLPNIVYACKAPIHHLFSIPNDVSVNQWYMNLIQAYDAWNITHGKAYVKVAIIDDEVKISHPDLTAMIYTNTLETLDGIDNDGNGYVDDIHGWDVSDNDNNPEPPASHWMYSFSDQIFSHGTHCAGIAAATTNNGTGIASIGYGISIIPVKCAKDNTSIPLALDAGPEGIDYAIAAGADIISLSWGSATNDSVTADAVNAALAHDIIVVAAAGNNGDTVLMYPASINGVISVGSVSRYDSISSFSERNHKVTVMAPGDSIWSCMRKNNGYMYQDGTSMACPMVAGLLGLMKSLDTSFTTTQLKNCLLAGCDNIDAINPTAVNMMGAGRINAYKSLSCLQTILNESSKKNDNKFYCFPNPASDKLFISYDNQMFFTHIEIVDLMGRLLKTIPLSAGVNTIEVNINSLSAGVYLLGLNKNKSRVVMQKFIKQ